MKNTVLVLGLMLVAANAIASGEMAQLWGTVKGSASSPIGGPSGPTTPTILGPKPIGPQLNPINPNNSPQGNWFNGQLNNWGVQW